MKNIESIKFSLTSYRQTGFTSVLSVAVEGSVAKLYEKEGN